MKSKKVMLVVFACLIVLQLSVPAYMILNREIVMHNGKQLKFRVEPVDPYHPFRGRYVSVFVGNNEINVDDEEKYYRGQKVYAVLEVDKEGFATISGILKTPPKDKEFIKTKVSYVYNHDGDTRIQIKQPFDRYYMEEKLAPKAEVEYNKRVRGRDENSDVYVTVRVLAGNAVLERLYIEGMTVEEYLKKNQEDKNN